ncbi:hypothetical protein Cadr_000010426 [Camelus dromedarius]|uniref:Uncharacterized protein n=1 Tax=Camelus dromedarius TaxID=9838 RepID=A0A5N4DXL3_CAMDR|nr:hypothetical protein Cadr_000010426 [Camelus dromedarius]
MPQTRPSLGRELAQGEGTRSWGRGVWTEPGRGTPMSPALDQCLKLQVKVRTSALKVPSRWGRIVRGICLGPAPCEL